MSQIHLNSTCPKYYISELEQLATKDQNIAVRIRALSITLRMAIGAAKAAANELAHALVATSILIPKGVLSLVKIRNSLPAHAPVSAQAYRVVKSVSLMGKSLLLAGTAPLILVDARVSLIALRALGFAKASEKGTCWSKLSERLMTPTVKTATGVLVGAGIVYVTAVFAQSVFTTISLPQMPISRLPLPPISFKSMIPPLVFGSGLTCLFTFARKSVFPPKSPPVALLKQKQQYQPPLEEKTTEGNEPPIVPLFSKWKNPPLVEEFWNILKKHSSEDIFEIFEPILDSIDLGNCIRRLERLEQGRIRFEAACFLTDYGNSITFKIIDAFKLSTLDRETIVGLIAWRLVEQENTAAQQHEAYCALAKHNLNDAIHYCKKLVDEQKYDLFFEVFSNLNRIAYNDWNELYPLIATAQQASTHEKYLHNAIKKIVYSGYFFKLPYDYLSDIRRDTGRTETIEQLTPLLQDYPFLELLPLTSIINKRSNSKKNSNKIDLDSITRKLKSIARTHPQTCKLLSLLIRSYGLSKLKNLDRLLEFQKSICTVLEIINIYYFDDEDGYTKMEICSEKLLLLYNSKHNHNLKLYFANDCVRNIRNNSSSFSTPFLLFDINWTDLPNILHAIKNPSVYHQFVSLIYLFRVSQADRHLDLVLKKLEDIIIKNPIDPENTLKSITTFFNFIFNTKDLEKISDFCNFDCNTNISTLCNQYLVKVKKHLNINCDDKNFITLCERMHGSEFFFNYYNTLPENLKPYFSESLSHLASDTFDSYRMSSSKRLLTNFDSSLIENWRVGMDFDEKDFIRCFDSPFISSQLENEITFIATTLPLSIAQDRNQKQKNKTINNFVKINKKHELRNLLTREMALLSLLSNNKKSNTIKNFDKMLELINLIKKDPDLGHGFLNKQQGQTLDRWSKQLHGYQQERSSDISNLKVSITQDPKIIWNSVGVSMPKSSCQNVMSGANELNIAILETLRNVTRQVIVVKNKKTDKIEARALIKLGLSDKKEPVLVIEGIYYDSNHPVSVLQPLCVAAGFEFGKKLNVMVSLCSLVDGSMPLYLYCSKGLYLNVFTTDLDFDYEDCGRQRIVKGQTIRISGYDQLLLEARSNPLESSDSSSL